MSKEEKVQYIRDLTQASSVMSVCRDLKIQRTNLYEGRTTEENIDLVAKELTRRVKEVLKKYRK